MCPQDLKDEESSTESSPVLESFIKARKHFLEMI
jgi:hypothetical protein